MPTINQLVRKGRRKKKRKPNRALQGAPQRAGVVLRTWVIKPKKPNSGMRKMARVRLSNGVEITATIPGQGMGGVQDHSHVLVQGASVPDVPGVNYKIIRGTLDCQGQPDRAKSRSRYGAKKPKGKR